MKFLYHVGVRTQIVADIRRKLFSQISRLLGKSVDISIHLFRTKIEEHFNIFVERLDIEQVLFILITLIMMFS